MSRVSLHTGLRITNEVRVMHATARMARMRFSKENVSKAFDILMYIMGQHNATQAVPMAGLTLIDLAAVRLGTLDMCSTPTERRELAQRALAEMIQLGDAVILRNVEGTPMVGACFAA